MLSASNWVETHQHNHIMHARWWHDVVAARVARVMEVACAFSCVLTVSKSQDAEDRAETPRTLLGSLGGGGKRVRRRTHRSTLVEKNSLGAPENMLVATRARRPVDSRGVRVSRVRHQSVVYGSARTPKVPKGRTRSLAGCGVERWRWLFVVLAQHPCRVEGGGAVPGAVGPRGDASQFLPLRSACVDGSCTDPTQSAGARAGWSAVQRDESSTMVNAAYGNVPSHFTQSAAGGEHAAFCSPSSSSSLGLTSSPTVLACSCAAILWAFQPHSPAWCSVGRKYGKEATSVQKIQRRQSLDDILDGSSARDELCNERAAELARKRELHAPTAGTWTPWQSPTNWPSAWTGRHRRCLRSSRHRAQ